MQRGQTETREDTGFRVGRGGKALLWKTRRLRPCRTVVGVRSKGGVRVVQGVRQDKRKRPGKRSGRVPAVGEMERCCQRCVRMRVNVDVVEGRHEAGVVE